MFVCSYQAVQSYCILLPGKYVAQDQAFPIGISGQAENVINNLGYVTLPDNIFHTWINGLYIVKNYMLLQLIIMFLME